MKAWTGFGLVSATVLLTLMAMPTRSLADDHWNCANFSSQEQAQEFLYPGDPSKLDPDKNGLACEGLPCPCVILAREGTRPAERISKSLIAGLTRHSRQLQSWSFSSCNKTGSSVICQLGAQGESIRQRIACRYRVEVRRARQWQPGRMLDRQCKAVDLPHLTMRRAKKAIRAAVEAAIGPRLYLGPIFPERDNRLSVGARVAWATEGNKATGVDDAFCEMFVGARLDPKTDEVHTSAGFPLCGSP